MEFDPTQRRVISVLLEKELANPERYPLTLNGLVAGCNQRSNRDPVMMLQDFEVEGCLRSLIVEGWIAEVRDGGRATKWKHRSRERLDVSEEGLGVLCELLLRGPQSTSELRTRCARLIPALDSATLKDAIEELSSGASPLIRNLGRRPGERVERWGQTLAPDDYESEASSLIPALNPPVDAPAKAGARPPPAAHTPVDYTELNERIESLEAEVRLIRERLRALEADEGETEAAVD